MLRQNLRYKILALLLAISLWLYVAITQQQAVETQAFTVPVELRNVGQKHVASVEPQRVRLFLRGRPGALESPAPAPAAYINLRNADPGQRTVEVSYIAPTETRLVRIEPPKVTVTVKLVTSRTMNIEARLVGAAPPGYLLGEPRITPTTVTVSGVRDAIARVSHVVVKVDANSARPDAPQTNPLRAVDENDDVVEGVELSRSEARVVIPVERTLSYETVPIVVRLQGNPAPGRRIAGVSVRPPVVTIAGDAERLRQVSYIRTAPLDIEGIDGDISRTARLARPDGITTVSDSEVEVEIDVEPRE